MRGPNWWSPLLFGATALVCGVICFWTLSLGPAVPWIIAAFFVVATLCIAVGVVRLRRGGRPGDGPTDRGPF